VQYEGREVLPVEGKSILGYLLGSEDRVYRTKPYGFSVHERQGLQFEQWKLLRLPSPLGNDEWELYDLEADPGETTNLAESEPDVLKDMVARWEAFVSETGVIISDPGSRAPRECARAAELALGNLGD